MSRGKSFAVGFFLAGTVSAAPALILTPASRRVLRHTVKEQGSELKQIAEDSIQDGLKLKCQIAKTTKEGVALMKDLTEDMRTAVEEWKQAIEPHQDNIFDYLEQIESSIKDLEEKIQKQESEEKE